MLLLSLLLGCEPPDYPPGPEVWSDPVPHEGDGWLFDWYAGGEIPAQGQNGRNPRAGPPPPGASYEELHAYYVPKDYEDIIEH